VCGLNRRIDEDH
jgi:hypothetical protein